MDVIPVIDIKDGQVVHAQGGKRDGYRPIKTPLSPTSEPLDVAFGLMNLYTFQHLYIADLDAIEGRGSNSSVIATIAGAMPQLELWADIGTSAASAAQAWLKEWPFSLVIGSESQTDVSTVETLRAEHRAVLSLDYRDHVFQGPDVLAYDAALWPSRVIVMTLGRVGSATGPDIDRLKSVITLAGKRQVFGAGGVRNSDDLGSLAHAGASGVLVATALHTGRITAGDLKTHARRPGRA